MRYKSLNYLNNGVKKRTLHSRPADKMEALFRCGFDCGARAAALLKNMLSASVSQGLLTRLNNLSVGNKTHQVTKFEYQKRTLQHFVWCETPPTPAAATVETGGSDPVTHNLKEVRTYGVTQEVGPQK